MPTQNNSEEKFREWLDSKKYSYLYIDQNGDTFPEFFRGISKRPDFLVVINRIGIIAVDVKDKYPSFDQRGVKCFTLDENKEVEKYLAFERLTRLAVWFVFYSAHDGYNTLYWVPLSKVLECKIEKSNDGSFFRIIRPNDCTPLQSKRDTIARIMD